MTDRGAPGIASPEARRGSEKGVRSLSRPCPRCGLPALLTADNAARPFCSDRCKKVDLGEWLLESIRIPEQEPGAALACDEDSGSF